MTTINPRSKLYKKSMTAVMTSIATASCLRDLPEEITNEILPENFFANSGGTLLNLSRSAGCKSSGGILEIVSPREGGGVSFAPSDLRDVARLGADYLNEANLEELLAQVKKVVNDDGLYTIIAFNEGVSLVQVEPQTYSKKEVQKLTHAAQELDKGFVKIIQIANRLIEFTCDE